MGKVFNSMILGVIVTLVLLLFNGGGQEPTSLFLLLLNPTNWENSSFWNVFVSLLTLGAGVIVIGLAAIIKQDWVLRAGIVGTLSSIVIFPFVDLFRAIVSQTNYISTGCTNAPVCDYINAIGGKHLYSKKNFCSNKINLKFIKTTINDYKQFSDEFIPQLSIIDILMFNSIKDIKTSILPNYQLI